MRFRVLDRQSALAGRVAAASELADGLLVSSRTAVDDAQRDVVGRQIAVNLYERAALARARSIH